jgi:hypothetical protein
MIHIEVGSSEDPEFLAQFKGEVPQSGLVFGRWWAYDEPTKVCYERDASPCTS